MPDWLDRLLRAPVEVGVMLTLGFSLWWGLWGIRYLIRHRGRDRGGS